MRLLPKAQATATLIATSDGYLVFGAPDMRKQADIMILGT